MQARKLAEITKIDGRITRALIHLRAKPTTSQTAWNYN
jgi:hypothetical protein